MKASHVFRNVKLVNVIGVQSTVILMERLLGCVLFLCVMLPFLFLRSFLTSARLARDRRTDSTRGGGDADER